MAADAPHPPPPSSLPGFLDTWGQVPSQVPGGEVDLFNWVGQGGGPAPPEYLCTASLKKSV